MNSWSDTIKVPRPLRDVLPARGPAMVGPGSPALQEQWRASYDLGRIEGEKALSEQLLKQRTETQELLQGVLNSLRQAVPQVVRDTENLIVTLALEVAQKLVADIPISAAIVEGAVRDALAQVDGTAHFTVRLNPADLALLLKADSPILKTGEKPGEFNFVAAPDIARGGCLVQTKFGTVDARRETKLELLKRSLLSC